MDPLRRCLHRVEELLKGYSLRMGGSTEMAVENAIQYSAVFAEVWFSAWGLAGH